MVTLKNNIMNNNPEFNEPGGDLVLGESYCMVRTPSYTCEKCQGGQIPNDNDECICPENKFRNTPYTCDECPADKRPNPNNNDECICRESVPIVSIPEGAEACVNDPADTRNCDTSDFIAGTEPRDAAAAFCGDGCFHIPYAPPVLQEQIDGRPAPIEPIITDNDECKCEDDDKRLINNGTLCECKGNLVLNDRNKCRCPENMVRTSLYNCEVCPDGTERRGNGGGGLADDADDGYCQLCAVGQWRDSQNQVRDMTSCEPDYITCPGCTSGGESNGQYCTWDKCKAGTYCNTDSMPDECKSCPSGQWSNYGTSGTPTSTNCSAPSSYNLWSWAHAEGDDYTRSAHPNGIEYKFQKDRILGTLR
tara:strand:- start:97 stop:1185 length:1089 start_codon:yes stop_codon:yes gene_type:complete